VVGSWSTTDQKPFYDKLDHLVKQNGEKDNKNKNKTKKKSVEIIAIPDSRI